MLINAIRNLDQATTKKGNRLHVVVYHDGEVDVCVIKGVNTVIVKSLKTYQVDESNCVAVHNEIFDMLKLW